MKKSTEKPHFKEPPNARKNFERTMKTLIQVPKSEVRYKPNTKRKSKGKD